MLRKAQWSRKQWDGQVCRSGELLEGVAPQTSHKCLKQSKPVFFFAQFNAGLGFTLSFLLFFSYLFI